MEAPFKKGLMATWAIENIKRWMFWLKGNHEKHNLTKSVPDFLETVNGLDSWKPEPESKYPGQSKEKNGMRELGGCMFPVTIGSIAFSGSWNQV